MLSYIQHFFRKKVNYAHLIILMFDKKLLCELPKTQNMILITKRARQTNHASCF